MGNEQNKVENSRVGAFCDLKKVTDLC